MWPCGKPVVGDRQQFRKLVEALQKLLPRLAFRRRWRRVNDVVRRFKVLRALLGTYAVRARRPAPLGRTCALPNMILLRHAAREHWRHLQLIRLVVRLFELLVGRRGLHASVEGIALCHHGVVVIGGDAYIRVGARHRCLEQIVVVDLAPSHCFSLFVSCLRECLVGCLVCVCELRGWHNSV